MPPGLSSDIPLDAVEARVAELLRADKRALKLAAELPVIWRIPVTVTEAIFFSFKHRWAARWTTRLYVETHVRRQLEAFRACLRLEFLGTTAPEDRDRIAALEEELARRVQPLGGDASWASRLAFRRSRPPFRLSGRRRSCHKVDRRSALRQTRCSSWR